jgi:hypothetical protein
MRNKTVEYKEQKYSIYFGTKHDYKRNNNRAKEQIKFEHGTT